MNSFALRTLAIIATVIQEILDNSEFRNQIPRLARADALGTLIEKFLDPTINLSLKPHPAPEGGAA